MKTTDNNQNKKFTELSDEELKQVTGGASIDCSLPENNDKFQCSNKVEGLDVILQDEAAHMYLGHDMHTIIN